MSSIRTEKVKHIVEAFMIIAKANHYMVRFASIANSEELGMAKQVLITKSNSHDNRDELIERALDLIELEIKGVQLVEGRSK